MELLIMGALAYAGKKINETDDDKTSKNYKKPKTIKKRSNKKSFYDSSNVSHARKTVQRKIRSNHNKAKNPRKTNIISSQIGHQEIKKSQRGDDSFRTI